ncbi:unnamed protein product [Prorocentrum cordatum]|uniref:SH3 domain-containing protein n=1 Tax=Prorocentrum cordatum TaxID=2364126 RepID=A0ABN9Q432_9DINO|nr:unnamed protein product [Polarella glacialis]
MVDGELWTVVGAGAKAGGVRVDTATIKTRGHGAASTVETRPPIGGLAVREGSGISAPELGQLLSTGAVVRALEHEGGHLRFELVRGEGPATGWVSTCFKGKALVAPVVEGGADEDSTTEGSSSEEADPLTPEEEVLLAYGARFSAGPVGEEEREAPRAGVDQEALEWRAGDAAEPRGCASGEARAELRRALQAACAEAGSEAQAQLRRLNEEEASRRQRDRERKEELRAEHGIGWKAENIPVSMASVGLGCEPQPSFMCALVLDGAGSIRVAPTVEPAAAVNLEYLSTALRVRREVGCEPFFSLDPVDGADTASMQQKRFEPAWLADTSLGEVMFQADYRLKELSMGEHAQPVVGMKSCLDLVDGREKDVDWNAREWFVVRGAAVAVSGDNALVPHIRMGVEAREQVVSGSGMEDAQVTRPDHPLARYAEAFTQSFDLIAERLSVVNQLREVAKASTLAKYLIDSGVQLDDSWFNLASAFEGSKVTKVPQLWNERYHARVQVRDGTIDEDDLNPRMHGVYGGVQFGLEKFTVGARAASASVQFARVGARGPMPRVSAALSMATSVTGGLRTPAMRAAVSMRAGGVPRGVQFGLEKFTVGARAASASVQFARVGARGPMPRVSAALSMATSVTGGLRTPAMRAAVSMRAGGVPRGVDLNLDGFELSEAEQSSEMILSQVGLAPPMGASFWQMIDDSEESLFCDKDIELLRAVFNPRLSDRRVEGDLFVPPPTCGAHAEKLRALIREEAAVQEQRKRHFFSAKFEEKEAGALFPSSWQEPFRAQEPRRCLVPRADLLEQAGELTEALGAAAPSFDQVTEEGSRFRAYRIGGLEVRTCQGAEGPETVGAVLAPRA